MPQEKNKGADKDFAYKEISVGMLFDTIQIKMARYPGLSIPISIEFTLKNSVFFFN